MRPLLAVLVLVLSGACSGAAQNCSFPVSPSHQEVIFKPEQEKRLGQVFAGSIEVRLHLIEDEAIVKPLGEIGGRLARALPPGLPRPQWFAFDSGEVNAFTIPGGRIYVSRRLITFARSEDELAAVMAHELGHMVARDPEAQASRLWRIILNKNAIATDAEIEPDYHQILDNYLKYAKQLRGGANEDKQQHGADEIGQYIVARAGYSPRAAADIFDRVAETKGQTGSWLSDLFGATRPDSKRLREILKTVSAIPGSCIETGTHMSAADFETWRLNVLAYKYERRSTVHSVLATAELAPLQAEVQRLRFSADGKYLLAQTDSSVLVFQHDPLSFMFEITARDTYPAQFSPDSRQVVFYDPDYRVERWDIPSRKRVAIDEVYISNPCLASALSPDGQWLACVDSDVHEFFPLHFKLYNVSSGQIAFAKRNFYSPGSVYAYRDLLQFLSTPLTAMTPFVTVRFSPDGNFVVAARRSTHLVLSLPSLREVRVPGSLTRVLERRFSFLGADRLFGVGDGNAAVVRFPGGDVLNNEPKIVGNLEGATRGDYLMIRPLRKFAVGIFDIAANQLILASPNPAMDVYDDQLAMPLRNGVIGVYPLKSGKVDSSAPKTVNLPQTSLGSLQAASISPDLSLAAVSEKERGAVWDLRTGARLFHVRGFRGAWFGEDGRIFALFPPDPLKAAEEETESDEASNGKNSRSGDNSAGSATDTQPEMVELDLHTTTLHSRQQFDAESKLLQAGRYLVRIRPAGDDRARRDWVLEISDVHAPAVLWSRALKYLPAIYADVDGANLALVMGLDTPAAKEVLKSDTRLAERFEEVKNEQARLVEIVDMKSGSVRSRFAVDTGKGSFRIRHLAVAGGRVVVVDNHDRVLLYSMSGEALGHLFGAYALASADGKLLCVEAKPGTLSILDASTLTQRDEFTFPSWVAAARFSTDGGKLGVVTADQNYYLLETGVQGGLASSDAAKASQPGTEH